jgi:hypothetical protein
MIDDNGAIYPNIKFVDFAEKVPKEPSRDLKRLLHITASYAQSTINYDKIMLNEQGNPINVSNETVFLSAQNESIWGKKIKIRLTSKETGKKIDLNLLFDHKFSKL